MTGFSSINLLRPAHLFSLSTRRFNSAKQSFSYTHSYKHNDVKIATMPYSDSVSSNSVMQLPGPKTAQEALYLTAYCIPPTINRSRKLYDEIGQSGIPTIVVLPFRVFSQTKKLPFVASTVVDASTEAASQTASFRKPEEARLFGPTSTQSAELAALVNAVAPFGDKSLPVSLNALQPVLNVVAEEFGKMVVSSTATSGDRSAAFRRQDSIHVRVCPPSVIDKFLWGDVTPKALKMSTKSAEVRRNFERSAPINAESRSRIGWLGSAGFTLCSEASSLEPPVVSALTANSTPIKTDPGSLISLSGVSYERYGPFVLESTIVALRRRNLMSAASRGTTLPQAPTYSALLPISSPDALDEERTTWHRQTGHGANRSALPPCACGNPARNSFGQNAHHTIFRPTTYSQDGLLTVRPEESHSRYQSQSSLSPPTAASLMPLPDIRLCYADSGGFGSAPSQNPSEASINLKRDRAEPDTDWNQSLLSAPNETVQRSKRPRSLPPPDSNSFPPGEPTFAQAMSWLSQLGAEPAEQQFGSKSIDRSAQPGTTMLSTSFTAPDQRQRERAPRLDITPQNGPTFEEIFWYL